MKLFTFSEKSQWCSAVELQKELFWVVTSVYKQGLDYLKDFGLSLALIVIKPLIKILEFLEI